MLDRVIEELEEKRAEALDKCNGYDFHAGRINAFDEILEWLHFINSVKEPPVI